jgi:hypothetical protein
VIGHLVDAVEGDLVDLGALLGIELGFAILIAFSITSSWKYFIAGPVKSTLKMLPASG